MADDASTRSQRLGELKAAATEYFSGERKNIESRFQFLDAISKKRGGSTGKFEDANDKGASQLLANSINDYLGEPLQAPSEQK